MICVELKPFREAVAKAAAVVKPKSHKPVLQCLLIVASNDVMTIRGTDLEVAVEIFCPCLAVEPLRVAILADKLRQCLTVAKGAELTIEINRAFVVLRSESQTWKLQTMAADEFPGEQLVSGAAWEIPERALKAALRVRKAAGMESARYVLNGVAFQVLDGQRFAVSTNGRCMICQELGPAAGDERIPILPAKAAAILANLLDDAGEASVEDDTRRMAVATGSVKFTASLLEGRYPAWRKASQLAIVAEATLSVEEFASVVRSASVTTNEERCGVDFNLADGELTLSSSAVDVGQSEASMPVAYSGPPIKVCLDPEFVLMFLAECDRGSTVTLSLSGEETGVRIGTDDGFWTVIMPLAKER